MTKDEALNVASQCKVTAAHPLCHNISVDGGNGLLSELLLDAAWAIEALVHPKQDTESHYKGVIDAVQKLFNDKREAQPEQEPVAWPCVIVEANFEQKTITLEMQCTDYKVGAGQHWLHTTPPAAQTNVGIGERGMEAYEAAKERGWVGLSDERLMEMPKQEPMAFDVTIDGDETDIHSCSLYCDRPACIKAQRDELRDKMAQPEQKKPQNCGTGYCSCVECVMNPEQESVIDKSAAIRIATALGWEPQRTWIGLTEEQRINISYKADGNECVAVELTEAKLKERNT